MGSIKDLDSLKNITPRTKSDGERRRTVSRQDEVSKAMSAANTPSEVGKLAQSFGITLDELLERGKSSPNFGQFRMVVGNRIRSIKRRMKEDKSLSAKDAAYPSKRAKAGTKETAKKAAPKKVAKKVVKKVVKKATVVAATPAQETANA